jgi:acyl-CoA synthetase (AMP-forming)/AMP-acid ligase II
LPSTDRSGSPDELAVIIYTSGTVAQPKGVRHSHRTLLAELNSDPDRKTRLSPWPQGHIAGYLNLLRFWAGGRRTVLMDRCNPEMAARLIMDYAVETSTGSPTHLSSLLEALSTRGANGRSLHSYLAGGTSIPPSLVQKCAALGIRTYRCYGLSEHPTVSRGDPDEPLDVRLATDGMPCIGTQVRIVADDRRDVEPGATGEIAVRGPETFLGYVDPLLDQDCFLDGGWFLTGDIGRIREDGRLIVSDRKKDVIIRGGETLSSREIEEALLRLPGITETAVVGFPDERLGERICAFVCCDCAIDISVAQIAGQFMDAGISRHRAPELILRVERLPKTSTGKVSKQELRHRVRQLQAGR